VRPPALAATASCAWTTSTRARWRTQFDGSPFDLPSLYDVDQVHELRGIVDYTVGPPMVKIFCLAEHPDPKQQHYLNLYKLGDGPLHPFWIPYHLPHFEAPNAISRVVLFGDTSPLRLVLPRSGSLR
jgi:predicted homoserine dehydrogenase-like protein